MMTVDTAKKILRKEIRYLKENPECKHLTVVFMGGEPFLNFSLIRKICEWIWKEYEGLPIKFFARSNGTVFTDAIKFWLSENRDRISIGLSLDGLPAVQDINRSESYARIPVDFFLENWPDTVVKATVMPDSVHMLYSSLVFFHERNIHFTMMMAQGVNWSMEALNELENQLSLIVDYYLRNDHLKVANFLFKSDFVNEYNIITNCQRRMCGYDGERIAYSADGRSYACFMFSELVLNREMSEKYNELSRSVEIIEPDSECDKCPAQPFCVYCMGINVKDGGRYDVRDKRICGVNYALLRANCKYYILKNEAAALSGCLSKEEWRCLKFALDHVDAFK